jgi:hypothetical protein
MAFPSFQNPLDWITQCWNITLGSKVNADDAAWLAGPIGGIGETPEEFIERMALERNLAIRRNAPGSGLIESFDPWGILVNARVADFYRRTSDYEFKVKSAWRPVFGSLGYLVARLFSRRVQQLNLPRAASVEVTAFRSEIIKLIDGDGHEAHTIWHRSLEKTREVVFYGIYGVTRIPSGELCVKAVFPLPRGNATVIFRVKSDPQGNLELLSSGKLHGDPGFYFLVEDRCGRLWKHYLPSMRECIRVRESGDGSLEAEHSLTLWSLAVYKMRYSIQRKRTDTRTEEGPPSNG